MNVLYEMNDGEYTGEIVDIKTEETTDGYPKVTWLLKIIGREYDGAFVEKKFYLKNPKVTDFLKKEFKLAGHEINGSDDMEAKKADIIGTRIKFSAVNNDAGFLVFYVKGVVRDSTWTPPFEGEKKKKAW